MDWKSTIGNIAPTLATTLGTIVGGPLGPLAGAAVSALCHACGLEPTKENAESVAKMAAEGKLTGDQIVAIQLADIAHSEKVQQMANDFAIAQAKESNEVEKTAAGDRDSARKREETVKDLTPSIGFYTITLGFFGLLVGMLFHSIPEANKAVIFTMIGSLGTAWVSCVAYFYGSSNAAKDSMKMLFNSQPIEKKK